MPCGGSLPCTSSTRPNRFRPSCSRAGSRSTITATIHPTTRTLRTWRSSNIGDSASLPDIAVRRAHAINSPIPPVNDAVHTAFKAAGNPDTVWQYYKLIGVQATPDDGRRLPPRRRTISATTTWPTSWSRPIRSCRISRVRLRFTLHIPPPSTGRNNNVYVNGAPEVPSRWAAAKVATASRGNTVGGDMSVLVATAPYDTMYAELDRRPAATTVRTYISGASVLSGGPV